jgi:hypothetical protein
MTIFATIYTTIFIYPIYKTLNKKGLKYYKLLLTLLLIENKIKK